MSVNFQQIPNLLLFFDMRVSQKEVFQRKHFWSFLAIFVTAEPFFNEKPDTKKQKKIHLFRFQIDFVRVFLNFFGFFAKADKMKINLNFFWKTTKNLSKLGKEEFWKE